MRFTQHKLTGALAALAAALAVVALALTGGAAADISQSKTVGDFEAIELEVVSSGSTTVDVTITNSTGDTVKTDSLSMSSDTKTKTYDLEPGDYTVSTTAGDTTVIDSETVSVVSTVSAFSSDTVDVGTSEEIVTDVEFSANTSALVEISNETGSVVYSEGVTGTVTGTENVLETVTYEPSSAENYTVDVSAEDTTAINSTYVGVESTGLFGGGGIIGGAGQTELIGFALIVGGLVYAYREDMI